MNNFSWETTFLTLFDASCARYRGGDHDFSGYYTGEDTDFLASIGCRQRELFDWVEDHCDEPDAVTRGTALLVAATRRDYFLVVQGGAAPDAPDLQPGDLPARDSELAGHRWLPRIIAKARAKLSGTLDPDIMYSCGGDRGFLREHDIHPADFLRHVWSAGDDDSKIAAFVSSQGDR